MFIKTDGGRECDGFTHEKNDCVVRALSIAYDINYAKIHSDLKKLGRKDGRGFHTADVMKGRPIVWIKYQHEIKRTVTGFLKDHPTGRYVVRIKGHAFPVIDGVIHDLGRFKMGMHVRQAWRVA